MHTTSSPRYAASRSPARAFPALLLVLLVLPASATISYSPQRIVKSASQRIDITGTPLRPSLPPSPNAVPAGLADGDRFGWTKFYSCGNTGDNSLSSSTTTRVILHHHCSPSSAAFCHPPQQPTSAASAPHCKHQQQPHNAPRRLSRQPLQHAATLRRTFAKW